MSLITEHNLPQILGAVLSLSTVYILRDVWKNWRWWRKGLTVKERDAMTLVSQQLSRCYDELEETQDERDNAIRQVGRRDHIILSHGLTLPVDSKGASDEASNS